MTQNRIPYSMCIKMTHLAKVLILKGLEDFGLIPVNGTRLAINYCEILIDSHGSLII